MALACRGQLAGQRQASRALAKPAGQSVSSSRGLLQIVRNRVLHGEHGHGNHQVKWFERQKELWRELTSAADLQQALDDLPADKMLVVDYYAGWCTVCKTAYPAMCRIADDKAHQQHYVFAKASLDHEDIKSFVKREGIKGIPHLSVYVKSGVKVMGMGASFKKAEQIKSNLAVMAEHKAVVQEKQQLLDMDPNFYVLIPGVPVAA